MSIYNTAVNKPISTLMVFIAIMVLGVASYIQLPVDQYPKMDPPYLTVMATYPASPSWISSLINSILSSKRFPKFTDTLLALPSLLMNT